MDMSSWLRKRLEETSPDLLRVMVKDFAEALMSADADAACGAGYGERSPERVNRRNGYRERDWDTRVGSTRGRTRTDDLLFTSLRQRWCRTVRLGADGRLHPRGCRFRTARRRSEPFRPRPCRA